MFLIKTAIAADEVDISNLYNPVSAKIPTNSTLSTLLSQDLLTFVFIIIGLIFFSNIIMAGWEYMLSTGDPKKVASATTRFMNGFIGLILSLMAYVIVRVITNFLGLGNIV